jgi:hypothetical protein
LKKIRNGARTNEKHKIIFKNPIDRKHAIAFKKLRTQV